MLIKTKTPATLLAGTIGTAIFLVPLPSYSISQTPLFLQQRVQPNIMLLVDDSGSMKYEVMLSDNTGCSPDCYLDFTPESDETKLRLCPGYNTLMYDPTKVYTHWDGVDNNGNKYLDANINAASENPFLGDASSGTCDSGDGFSSISRVCNLTSDMRPDGKGAYYYPWVDDGDGIFEPDECPIEDTDRVWIHSLDADDSGGNTNNQQNFANWFSYYRKGEYVMKRALSTIISDSQERVGIATLNRSEPLLTSGNDGEDVGTEIADLDTTSLPINQEAVENKKQLLRNLFRITPAGGTPLRKGLKNVGRYFEEGNSIGGDLFGFQPENGSPILSAADGGECQQNFVIALSDGHWNGSSPEVGDTDGDSNSDYDGRSYADGYPETLPTETAAEKEARIEGYSNTLADVAMHYYERDLNTNLDNDVPTTTTLANGNSDDNPAQHLVTYTVAFGLSGTIPLDNSTACYPSKREDSVESQGWPSSCTNAPAGLTDGWPAPIENTTTTIDDMLHAAWNGRGEFLSATDPQALINKLGEAIEDIASRTDTTTAAAAVTVNSTNMRSGGVIYQAGFDPDTWAGQLFAYNLSGATLTEKWRAHTQLSALPDPNSSRVIFTYNGHAGTPLSFPADYQNPDTANGELDLEQVKDLLTNATHPFDTGNVDKKSANQAFGESIVEYLRGSSDNEGTGSDNFRPRNDSLLADIIHSAPVFVGSPNPAQYPDFIEGTNNSYHTWANRADNASRKPMIYVGTNGGGLHGFDANTGAEDFVYIPKSLFSNADHAGLHWLAEPGYTHRYYADQTPAINNVFIDGAWKTVLVSGLRGGGKALFALDVTSPSAFNSEDTAAQKVLWEVNNDTAGIDNNLGHTFSQPTLAKLNNGAWAAIIGNGYDNGPNGDGRARLFIIDLSTGLVIKSIDTGAGTIANNDCDDAGSNCNGLSTPAVVDLDGNGIADRAYAGDLQGNLWVFDLSSADSTVWDKKLLFKAEIIDPVTSELTPQPITSRPAVTLHPHQKGIATAPNTMVFFGTGQYINSEDIDNTATQSFYGIWDNGTTVTNGRSDLVQQSISTDATIPDNVRIISNEPANYSTKRGWHIDFTTESKERVIVNPITFGQLVIFTTTIPDQNVCGIAGGSWLMVLDSNSGGEPKFTALDVNSDGLFSEEDMINNLNVSGLRSGDLYWQPNIIQTGSGNSGTIILPTDDDPNNGDVSQNRLDQINIQGMLPSKARSSWSRFNF
ncbi:pilus assembly protein [Pseudomonadota bacterium]